MRRIFVLILSLSFLALPARGAEEPRLVALTFDDGPSGHFTEELLEGLRQRQVPATFLLCGYRMAEFPELTARIFREGHEIGFHGYSHENMGNMSRRQIGEELIRSGALLPPDCSPRLFRPPGGVVGDNVRQVAGVRLLSILTWSVDPRDWATGDRALVVRRVLRQVKDGDVILLHDMSDSSVAAALEIVDRLRQQGYEFLTVSQLAKARNVRLKPGESYQHFPPVPRKGDRSW